MDGCSSIEVSPLCCNQFCVVFRTKEDLSQRMLAAPKQHYPIELGHAAYALSIMLRGWIARQLVRVSNCELLLLAATRQVSGYSTDDLKAMGVQFDPEARMLSVPIVKEGTAPPTLGKELSPSQRLHIALNQPPFENFSYKEISLYRRLGIELKFVPDWEDAAAITTHAERIEELSIGWSYKNIGGGKPMADGRYSHWTVKKLLAEAKTIVRLQ
jgi:hypothetical protein